MKNKSRKILELRQALVVIDCFIKNFIETKFPKSHSKLFQFGKRPENFFAIVLLVI